MKNPKPRKARRAVPNRLMQRKVLFRWLLLALAAAVPGLALGLFFAAVTSGAPAEWLVIQSETGRPPKLAALLAVGPILVVALAAIVVKVHRAKDRARDSSQGLTHHSSGAPPAPVDFKR